jgi:hypothetical protein
MMKPLALACALGCGLAMGSPAALAEEPLGRLFFTPAQRASLDVARSQRTRTTVGTEEMVEEQPAPVPEHFSYDGVVRRSDGRTTVWINRQAVHDPRAAQGSPLIGSVRPDGVVSLEMPESKRRVELKVGQTVDSLSGTVQERYLRRSPEAQSESADAGEPARAEPDASTAPPESGQAGRTVGQGTGGAVER